jgi:ubiquinone/menaquinone biosynthesis C-methylase UbiE
LGDWNSLAELDPLWTVLSAPEKKFGKWDPQEFFSTGEKEANRVLKMCESFGLPVSFGKMLDFGCAVGRMTRGFSTQFKSCTGVDVSQKMVELAGKYNADRPNCSFLTSTTPNLPFHDETFDFVFTTLVLQHLPTQQMILNFISEFFRVAKVGGAVVFQLPIAVPLRRRIQARRRIWALLAAVGVSRAWLFERAGLAPIQINGVAREKVERFIKAQGGDLRGIQQYDPNEGSFHSNYYLAIKTAVKLR